MALPVLQNSGGPLALAGGGMLMQAGGPQEESGNKIVTGKHVFYFC